MSDLDDEIAEEDIIAAGAAGDITEDEFISHMWYQEDAKEPETPVKENRK